jgi:hypothetical protein
MKYIKLRSLTWWSGVVPLLAGVFVATVDLHGVQSIVNSINALSGNMQPSAMVVYGLTVIGFRGTVVT